MEAVIDLVMLVRTYPEVVQFQAEKDFDCVGMSRREIISQTRTSGPGPVVTGPGGSGAGGSGALPKVRKTDLFYIIAAGATIKYSIFRW